jgi:hypothetical protein
VPARPGLGPVPAAPAAVPRGQLEAVPVLVAAVPVSPAGPQVQAAASAVPVEAEAGAASAAPGPAHLVAAVPALPVDGVDRPSAAAVVARLSGARPGAGGATSRSWKLRS